MLWLPGMPAMLLSPMAQSTDALMIGGKTGFMKPPGSNNDPGFSIGAKLGMRIQGNFH